MDRTPCFNTLAANWQSAKIERADAGLEDLHAELTNDMQRALAGLQTHVPGSVQLIPTQQTAKGYQMHSERDMVRKAEDGFARFHDAINARLEQARQMLYAEFIGCWMKSPGSMVQTPGFATNGMTVAEVVTDHFAGASGEADEVEMLSIIAAVAKQRDANGERARTLMDRMGRAHADFHAEDAM